METATERLYRLLLVHPKDMWSQVELSRRARCSPGFTSRVVAALTAEGVIGRPYKNRVVLLSPGKLLALWASRRFLPPPVWVSLRGGPEEAAETLVKIRGVAFTLFYAAWVRTRSFRTSAVEAYVPAKRLARIAERLGGPASEPTAVSLYPAEGPELEGLERIDGRPLVSVPQNVADLIAVGGQGPRVAFDLARAYGLLGE